MSTKKTIGIKAFDKDLKCRDMQYEVGKTYEIPEGTTLACCPSGPNEAGLHACEYGLDVLGYYPPDSRFCLVESDLPVKSHNGESKFAASKLHISTEISFKNLVDLSVKFILDRVTGENKESGNQSAATNTGYQSAATNTGHRSAATNTGHRSAATNTGYQSAATNTGDQSAATNTGHRSAATNTGDQSAATNTGYQSAATNTGNQSAATNTGDQSAATNTGDQSAATNTGHRSAATNTGNQSAATNTGHRSAATNTGDRSAATNTGYQSAATNTGHRSAATNTGYQSAAIVEGKESVAVSLGIQGKAKGALGCFLVLAEWKETPKEWVRVNVLSTPVDGVTIRADTFYTAKDGEIIEA